MPSTTHRQRRAAEYRERANQLKQIADSERSGPLRSQLISLAVQYERMAEDLHRRADVSLTLLTAEERSRSGREVRSG